MVSDGRASTGGRQVPTWAELDKLRAENERLRTKLAKAEAIIEIQGKVQALLEELSKSADTDDTSTSSSTLPPSSSSMPASPGCGRVGVGPVTPHP